MDNDNKVIESIPSTHRNEVLLFLKDELQPLSHDKPHAYDLTAEYAKTKKNKSPFIWVLMALCFVVAIIATYGISKYVDYQNNHIKVSIDVFNDLNLRNLLDIVSQTKGQHDDAVKEKSELEAELTAGLQQAERKRDADLFTVQSLKLGTAEARKRRTAIQAEYTKTVQTLHDTYDVKIAAQESLVKQYQQQLADYDSSKVEQAKEQEAAIDSTKQLFEIEKQHLKEQHEADMQNLRKQAAYQQQQDFENQKQAVNEVTVKYQKEIDALDPVVTDASNIIQKAADCSYTDSYEWKSLSQQLPPSVSTEFKNAVGDLSNSLADFSAAQKIVAAVPQKNSIPSFVKAMSQLAYHAGNSLAFASMTEVSRLSKQNDALTAKIEDERKAHEQDVKRLAVEKEAAVQVVTDQSATYQSYLGTICADNHWDGFILSYSKTTKLPVYLVDSVRTYFTDPVYKGVAVKGTIKRKNAKVAAVTFGVENGIYYCTTDDMTAGGRVKVGDWLSVDKPQVSNSTTTTTE